MHSNKLSFDTRPGTFILAFKMETHSSDKISQRHRLYNSLLLLLLSSLLCIYLFLVTFLHGYYFINHVEGLK